MRLEGAYRLSDAIEERERGGATALRFVERERDMRISPNRECERDAWLRCLECLKRRDLCLLESRNDPRRNISKSLV